MWQGFLPNNIKYTGNFVSFANLASLRGIEQLYFIGVLFYREQATTSCAFETAI